jgi:hypothetical protein
LGRLHVYRKYAPELFDRILEATDRLLSIRRRIQYNITPPFLGDKDVSGRLCVDIYGTLVTFESLVNPLPTKWPHGAKGRQWFSTPFGGAFAWSLMRFGRCPTVLKGLTLQSDKVLVTEILKDFEVFLLGNFAAVVKCTTSPQQFRKTPNVVLTKAQITSTTPTMIATDSSTDTTDQKTNGCVVSVLPCLSTSSSASPQTAASAAQSVSAAFALHSSSCRPMTS